MVQSSAFARGWADVKLRPFLIALGDLLTVLITIDTIVQGNRMVRGCTKKCARQERERRSLNLIRSFDVLL